MDDTRSNGEHAHAMMRKINCGLDMNLARPVNDN
jgi:hypothetical protein